MLSSGGFGVSVGLQSSGGLGLSGLVDLAGDLRLDTLPGFDVFVIGYTGFKDNTRNIQPNN